MENNKEQKSLEDLEKLYSKKKAVRPKSDLTYDKLHITEDEFGKVSNNTLSTNFQYNNNFDNPINETYESELLNIDQNLSDSASIPSNLQQNKDIIIEAQNFLAKSPEDIVNNRYETPFKAAQKILVFWETLTVITALIIIGYFIFILWINLKILSTDQNITKDISINTMTTLDKLIKYYSKQGNMLYGNYMLNLLITFIGILILIYSSTILILSRYKHKICLTLHLHKKIIKYSYLVYFILYCIGTMIQIIMYKYNEEYKEMKNSSSDGGANDAIDKEDYKLWKYFFIFLVISCFLIKLLLLYSHYLSYKSTEKMKLINAQMMNEILTTVKINDGEQTNESFENTNNPESLKQKYSIIKRLSSFISVQ